MNNWDLLGTVLTAIALGQSVLTASILASRSDFPDIRLPLLVFFAANAVTEFSSLPSLFELENKSLVHAINLAGVPSVLLLAPAIWMYVCALTSEEPIRFQKRHLLHLAPCILGIGVCIAMASVSESVREQIIGDADKTDAAAVQFVTLLVIAIVLINLAQFIAYMIPIYTRLLRYWSRLKDLFASTHRRELTWVIWMLALLTLNVAWAFISTFLAMEPEYEIFAEVSNVALIWLLSVWGLKQAPGLRSPEPNGDFASLLAPAAQAEPDAADPKIKYEKSALSDEQIDRIAAKVEQAMAQDKLYLNPNLSLRDLAAHIATYPNYVSQTMNSRLGATFFDFINGWRIRDAMPRLAQTDEQVTNIAYDVGFNSRSSFYNAFKKEAGLTPTQYRKRAKGGGAGSGSS